MAQAVKFKQEFGTSTTLSDWKLFLAAYNNVCQLNMKLKDVSKEAELWATDKEFRAMMILQQLRGEPLLWLSQDENKEKLLDDEEVIKALEQRYGHTKARVAYINDFEDIGQESGEGLAAFLSRVQQLASVAFPMLSDDAKRERVLSKFVRSVKDTRLKEELQTYGFIDEDSGLAKSYDSVLGKATRLESCWRAAGDGSASVNPVRTDPFVKELQAEITELKDQVAALRPAVSGRQHTFVNFQCWYCGSRDHKGGWRQCPVRKRESPSWRPRIKPPHNGGSRRNFQ